jgi:hypothetical protein
MRVLWKRLSVLNKMNSLCFRDTLHGLHRLDLDVLFGGRHREFHVEEQSTDN